MSLHRTWMSFVPSERTLTARGDRTSSGVNCVHLIGSITLNNAFNIRLACDS